MKYLLFIFVWSKLLLYWSCHKRWAHIAVGMCLGTESWYFFLFSNKNDDWLRLNLVSLFGLSNTCTHIQRCIWVTANKQTLFGNGILTAPIANPFISTKINLSKCKQFFYGKPVARSNKSIVQYPRIDSSRHIVRAFVCINISSNPFNGNGYA